MLVSVRNAVYSPDLETLQQTVEEQFRVLDEQEKKTRTAVARLEASLVRRFVELETHD